MINLGNQTIKEMLNASAVKQESTSKVSAKQKKEELERHGIKNLRRPWNQNLPIQLMSMLLSQQAVKESKVP